MHAEEIDKMIYEMEIEIKSKQNEQKKKDQLEQ